MTVNKELGGIKAAMTNKTRYGDDFYKNIGQKGGLKKNPNKGFGSSKYRASIAGRKGGLKSRKVVLG